MADKKIDTSSNTKVGVGADSSTLGKESATGAIRKMFDDTKTRKAVNGEVVGDTDTGNIKKISEEAVKLQPLSGQNPVQANGENKQSSVSKASSRKTVKLKPISTNTSSVNKEIGETGTGKIADPLKRRDSNTGAMQKLIDDTKTRKTIQLKKTDSGADQQAETVIEGIDTSINIPDVDQVKAPSSQTQKFKARQTQRLKRQNSKKAGKGKAENAKEASETSVDMPSISQIEIKSSQTQKFKARQTQHLKGHRSRKPGRGVPGTNETIKLRPAAGDDKSSPAEEQTNSKKETIRMAPIEHADSSDTIKISKKIKDPDKMVAPAKKAKVVGNEILATDTVKAMASDSEIKTAKVVQPASLSAETAQTIKLNDLGNEAKLDLPKRPTMAKSSNAPTAPTQKLKVTSAKITEKPKSAGLKVKKHDIPAGAGAPIAHKGEEEFGSGTELKKKKRSGDASIFYTILAIASLILLSLATYITAAQYLNLWEQERVGQEIPIPVINDYVNQIGD